MSTLTQAQAEIAELALAVTYRPVAELKPDPKNARQHSKPQIKKLSAVHWRVRLRHADPGGSSGGVIAGHARLLAAKQLGMTEVPTIGLEHLSEAQIAAYKIADNRLSELSTWDDQLLAESLRDLSLLNLDFSLELTGFDMGEIDLRIEGLEIVPEKGRADPADAVAEAVPGPACLDARRPLAARTASRAVRQRARGGELRHAHGRRKAAMVFTDPPYNVPIRGHVSGLGRVQHREFAMALGRDEPGGVRRVSCGKPARCWPSNSRDGSLHFICMDWRHLQDLLQAAGAGLCRAEEPVRLGQGQRRHGFALPQPA